MADRNICTVDSLSAITANTNAIVEENGALAKVSLADVLETTNKVDNMCTYGPEVQIGTMADGSPVYQTVIIASVDSWAETSAFTMYKISHDLKTFDKILDFSAVGCKGTNAYPLPFISTAGNINTFLYGIDHTSLNFYNKATWAGYTMYITIKYSRQVGSSKA